MRLGRAGAPLLLTAKDHFTRKKEKTFIIIIIIMVAVKLSVCTVL